MILAESYDFPQLSYFTIWVEEYIDKGNLLEAKNFVVDRQQNMGQL